MSKFSGKCDFYDFIEIHGFDYVKNSKVYLGYEFDRDMNIKTSEPLKIETIKDCVPYYPHIVSMFIGDKEHGTVFLTEKSWVDIEEEETGRRSLLYDYYREALEEEMKKYED